MRRALASVVERWVHLWDRREGPEALCAVRVGVALVLLFDLATVARFDLVQALWAPVEEGGIGPTSYDHPVGLFYAMFGASTAHAWLLFAIACTSATSLLVGLFSRTSALLLALSYAQLAQISPDADRGIDALLRNALLVLACSGAGATFSLDARLSFGRWVRACEVPAWPRYFLVLQLVVLYFWAGLLKQAPAWTALDGYSALYIVLSQPHYATFALPPALVELAYPALQLATFASMLFERGAIALPVLLHLRATRQRGGLLRNTVNRTRLLELWVVTGVVFHLGLALTLELGIFPWGCLALYPALAQPRTLAAAAEKAAGVLRARSSPALRRAAR